MFSNKKIKQLKNELQLLKDEIITLKNKNGEEWLNSKAKFKELLDNANDPKKQYINVYYDYSVIDEESKYIELLSRPGVYAIVANIDLDDFNEKTLPIYIGSTTNIFDRWLWHANELRKVEELNNINKIQKEKVKDSRYYHLEYVRRKYHNDRKVAYYFIVLQEVEKPKIERDLFKPELEEILKYNSSLYGLNATLPDENSNKTLREVKHKKPLDKKQKNAKIKRKQKK